VSESPDQIVIVGAGLAGLTAATYLSKAGHKVLLLEKNNNSGGLLNSFERHGFVFDVGARSIENAGIIKPMLKDLGIDLELLESPVSLGYGPDVIDFSSSTSLEDYKMILEKLFPENSDDIKNIIKVIKKVVKDMDVIYGSDNPVFRDYKNDKSYLFKELLPWFGKFLRSVSHMNRMTEPIESYLDKKTSNRSLANIIDQHFFKQTPMFFALGYFYVYQDYIYPKGGTGKLAEKLTEKFTEHGGHLQTDTQIIEINASKQTLKDNKGQTYQYDKLIWAADLKTLYGQLDTSQLNDKTRAQIQSSKDKICARRGGDSVFTLYLGLDKPLEEFSKISHGHFFYTPSKQGLGETHLKELHTLIKNFDKASKAEVLAWLDNYCKFNTYEMSIPALRDPDLAPEGKTGLIVNFFFEYDLIMKVQEAGWYEEFKIAIEDRILNTLERSIYPGIKDSVMFRFSYTPKSIETHVGTSEGGITGWSYEQSVPVVSNLIKIPKSVKTPIPNVLQAGQWAYSPAGIPTAILTGKYAAENLIKNSN
jgi:phytoene dehydrogenase-like protein